MIYKSLEDYLKYKRDRYSPLGMSSKEKDITLASCPGDPLHSGHIAYLRASKELRPENDLFVIVNGDSFLLHKKGFRVLPAWERANIIGLLSCVDTIIIYDAPDKWTLDVSECILKIKPDIFTNGGDRVKPNTKEEKACKEIGCVMSHGVGGYNKVLSSTQMLRDGLTYYRTWQMQNTCSFCLPPDPLGLDQKKKS